MDQMRPEAETRIKTRLVLEAVAKAENVKVTAKDIDKELEKMAEMYKMEVDKLKEMMGDAEKEQISQDIAVQKAVDLLVKEAVETEPAKEEKAEE
ncbi:MAG: trigger factor, partial [Roseburia sp.]|nr:trigger factor [Roseburia sp.]